MYFGWPQVIYIFLMLFGLVIHMAKHGQRREDTYDAGLSFFCIAISLALLYWGGFFSNHVP